MSDVASLLPSNASTAERATEQAAARLGAVPLPLREVTDPDACPPALLPWLAWSWGIDEWDDGWSEDVKRESVRKAYAIHAHKGSVQSIREVLASAGYGDAVIIEGLHAGPYGGVITHSGVIAYNGDMYYGRARTHWAMYRVYLSRPITIAQAAQVRRMLAVTAPVRCSLEGLHYTEALSLYDNRIRYDGAYTHGVA